jgi:hypothetical protein
LLTDKDLTVDKVSAFALQPGASLVDGQMQLELKTTVRLIHDCIADACGETAADAIEHFAPSSLAVYDPEAYESRLTELLPVLSTRIVKAIEAAVSRQDGVEIRRSETLFQCMMRVSLNKGGMSSIIGP